MTDSRVKGAAGEREAAKYLNSLGFNVSRMGRNGYSDADLDTRECDVLSSVHVEVKRGKSLKDGTALMDQYCEQATRDAGDKPWCVLWRADRGKWCLTFNVIGVRVTTTTDDRIKHVLMRLSRGVLV